MGVPAALVLQRMDRTNLSAEQNAGIDTFLAEYQQLKSEDVRRLGNSVEFLLDTLASEDAVLRRLALERLKQVTGQSIEFDPDGSAEARAAQLQKLRDSLGPSTNRGN